MSEPSAGTSRTAEERDWEGPVRRIADRLRGTAPHDPASGDRAELVEELAALERRALEAEETLGRERAASSVRLREMEAKFRKLEPFLRRLRTQFHEAGRERDRLRERLTQAEQRAVAAADSDVTSLTVLHAECEAAHREAEAAATSRDAAIAEAASLRTRLDGDARNVQESWRQRIEAAETSREKALEEIKSLRGQLVNQRRADDEIKRLIRERESLETTVSVHKAVARAAQEEAQATGLRAAEAAKALAAASVESAGRETRVADLDRTLAATRAELAAARTEISAARAEVAASRERETERATKADTHGRDLTEARAEADRLRRALDEGESRIAAARAECETLRRSSEELRAEAAAARESAARNDADSSAERTRRSDELETLRREAAAAREALGRVQAAAANETRAIEEAAARLRDAETRIEVLLGELSDLRRVAEAAQASAAVGDTERASLARSLEQERADASRRFEAAETSWRCQMRAAEGRFEADMHRERQKFALSEASLAAEENRHAEELAALDASTARLRATAESTLRRMARDLQELAANVASSGGSQLESDEQRPPATAELAPGDIPGVVLPVANGGDVGAPDWERVFSDVEELQSQVDSLREPVGPEDTASVGADERRSGAAAPAAPGSSAASAPKEDTGTASAEPPLTVTSQISPAPQVPPAAPVATAAQAPNDGSKGGRRRRR